MRPNEAGASFDLDGTLIDSSDDLTRAESRFRRAWLGRALARSVKYLGSHSITARARAAYCKQIVIMGLRETSAAVHTPAFAASRMDFESIRFRVATRLALALFR